MIFFTKKNIHIYIYTGIVKTTDSLLFQIQMSEHNSKTYNTVKKELSQRLTVCYFRFR